MEEGQAKKAETHGVFCVVFCSWSPPSRKNGLGKNALVFFFFLVQCAVCAWCTCMRVLLLLLLLIFSHVLLIAKERHHICSLWAQRWVAAPSVVC